MTDWTQNLPVGVRKRLFKKKYRKPIGRPAGVLWPLSVPRWPGKTMHSLLALHTPSRAELLPRPISLTPQKHKVKKQQYPIKAEERQSHPGSQAQEKQGRSVAATCEAWLRVQEAGCDHCSPAADPRPCLLAVTQQGFQSFYSQCDRPADLSALSWVDWLVNLVSAMLILL